MEFNPREPYWRSQRVAEEAAGQKALWVSLPVFGSCVGMFSNCLQVPSCHQNSQTSKVKQFNKEYDVLCSRENNPWTEEVQCLRSNRALFLNDFGREWVLVLEAAHKNREKLPGVTNLTLFRKIKEQRNKYIVQRWVGIWWLATAYTSFLVKHRIYRNRKAWFADVVFWEGVALSCV